MGTDGGSTFNGAKRDACCSRAGRREQRDGALRVVAIPRQHIGSHPVSSWRYRRGRPTLPGKGARWDAIGE